MIHREIIHGVALIWNGSPAVLGTAMEPRAAGPSRLRRLAVDRNGQMTGRQAHDGNLDNTLRGPAFQHRVIPKMKFGLQCM
jgi:hypothetical protein